MGFVVYWHERLRDGTEEGARCFSTQDAAVEFINNAAQTWFAACNTEFLLFHLGAEIPLEPADMVEKPQPPKVTRGFRIKDDGQVRARS